MPSFRTIVFFGSDPSGKEEMTKAFAHVPFVNVFATQDAEELSQILKQSEQAAVFVRTIGDVNTVQAFDFETQNRLCFCTFYLDKEGILTTEQIELLSVQRVSALKCVPIQELINRVSFLFLGKVNPSHFDGHRPPAVIERNQKRKSYFSHYKFLNNRWELIASTHMQDPEIEERFGKSWSSLSYSILELAPTLKSISEDKDFCQDYSILIFPHPAKVPPAMSIVNIKKGFLTYKDLRDSAIAFLKKL